VNPRGGRVGAGHIPPRVVASGVRVARLAERDRCKELPIEPSMKWLNSFARLSGIQALCANTQLVSIGDRESDIFDLCEGKGRREGGGKGKGKGGGGLR
jgi:hypothetical protein